jgi:hypothetical protein
MITGEKDVLDVPKINFLHFVHIAITTVRAMLTYKTLGAVQTVSKLSRSISVSNDGCYLFYRNVVTLTLAILNLFRSNKAWCLERSVIICAVLRKQGIPAQVVIGAKSAMNSSADFPFHAWVEVFNIPVSDHLGVRSHFFEMHRYPMEDD